MQSGVWSLVEVVRGTHPDEADDDAPDEAMLALLPYRHTDGSIGGKPVHSHEDVRRGEVETEGCQGISRSWICGHGETGLFPFFFSGIFLSWIGTE